LKPPQSAKIVEEVYANINSLELKSEDPYIDIVWHTYSEEQVEITLNFNILYLENGKYVSCAKKDIKFSNDTFILQYNSDGQYENRKQIRYSLEDFDLSKEGTYRFIPPIGNKEYIEFKLVKYPTFNNIPHEVNGVFVGYGGDIGLDVFTSQCENGTDSTIPLIRIENRQQLENLFSRMNGSFYEVRELKAALENCDDAFFEKQTLFVMFKQMNSTNTIYKVIGVEDSGRGKCSITVSREEAEVGLQALTGKVFTISMAKEKAAEFKTFDISFFDINYGNTYLI